MVNTTETMMYKAGIYLCPHRVYTCVERHNKINSYTVVQVLGRKRKPIIQVRIIEVGSSFRPSVQELPL